MKKTFQVTNESTAKEMGSGSLAVLATPALVAMLENVACDCIAGRLSDEETTVGAHMQIDHLRPSAIGTQITCEVVCLEQKGKKLYFDVQAFDGENCIAKGKHTRAIVMVDSFMSQLGKVR